MQDRRGARLYDRQTGLFISPDPTVAHPDDSQDLDQYAYVQDNPMSRVDRWGLSSTSGGGSPHVLPPITISQCNALPTSPGCPLGSGEREMAEQLLSAFSNYINVAQREGWGMSFGAPSSIPGHNKPQTHQDCGAPSLLPHGAGISGGAEGEVGLPKVAGAGGSGSAGAGEFYSSTTGFSHGEFASGGAAVYAGNSAAGAPAQTSTPQILLGSAGVGGSIFVTNAQSVQQLSGPFTTYSLNVGVGPIQFGAQLALGNGIWDLSISPPYGGITFGLSASKLTTMTKTSSDGCT